ncbi:PIN domain-containing protein [Shewanella algae]|uniref:PIN domain-containing protein n=1 Tax=Shewanella algae TaxID=38313 RepID=UPI00313C332D
MVSQSHSGNGDNIAGNKSVVNNNYQINGVTSKDLVLLVNDIAKHICHRDFAKAQELLAVANRLDGVGAEVNEIMWAISQEIDYLKEGLNSFDRARFLSILRNENIPMTIKSILYGVFIDIVCISDKESAIAIYRDIVGKFESSFLNEVFYRCLSDRDVLISSSSFDSLLLKDDLELLGIIRGLNRHEEFSLSLELCVTLYERFPSDCAKRIRILTEACLYATEINRGDIFSIDIERYNALTKLIEEFFDFSFDDKLRTIILINLNIATSFCFEELITAAYEVVDDIAEIDGSIAETIRKSCEGIGSDLSINLTSEVITPDEYSKLCLSMVNNSIDFADVRSWVSAGGKVSFEEEVCQAFADLNLCSLLYSCSEDDIKLRGKLRTFISNYSEEFDKISYMAMLNLCNRMLKVEQHVYVCDLLKPFVHQSSWQSPLFNCYLESLFQSEKYDSFIKAISHLEHENKSKYILVKECSIYWSVGDFANARKSILELIKREPEDAEAWASLLVLEKELGSQKDDLVSLVDSIPSEVFKEYKQSTLGLLYFIAKELDVGRVLSVMSDWFVCSPNELAKPLTDIHTNLISDKVDVITQTIPTERCLDGVVYSDGFNKYSKILVRGVIASHPSLIAVDSPIGSVLSRLNIGESENIAGIGEITLLERMNPLVATFRHAMDIRSSTNDGSDAFRQLEVPSDSNEMVDYLTRFMKSVKGDETKQKSILENPSIPFSMKIQNIYSSYPVKGAIICLSSKGIAETIKLNSEGTSIEDCESIIIDLLTACYLAVTGFANTFSTSSVKLYVNDENARAIRAWLDDINRDDYMTVNVTEYGLVRSTGDEIRAEYSDFISCLELLLERASILTPTISDVPSEVVELKRFFDQRVYSTFRESVTYNIPWLCLDHFVAGLAIHYKHQIVSISDFVNRNVSNIDYEDRHFGLRLAIGSGLPVPIMYADLITMSMSSNIRDVYLVSEFFKNSLVISNDKEKDMLSILTRINVNLIENAYLDRNAIGSNLTCQFRMDIIEKVFNYSCRAVISSKCNGTCEQKLARFVVHLFGEVSHVNVLNSIFQRWASMFVIGNFLDIKEVNRCIEVDKAVYAAESVTIEPE